MTEKVGYSIGVLTLSDKGARGEREDESGRVLGEMVASLGAVVRYEVIPDEEELIVETLVQWVDRDGLDLILTTGGTGLTARDVTPEATARVIDRITSYNVCYTKLLRAASSARRAAEASGWPNSSAYSSTTSREARRLCTIAHVV